MKISLTDLRWVAISLISGKKLTPEFSIFCRRSQKLKIGGSRVLVVTLMRKKSSLKNIYFFLSNIFSRKTFRTLFFGKIKYFCKIWARRPYGQVKISQLKFHYGTKTLRLYLQNGTDNFLESFSKQNIRVKNKKKTKQTQHQH